MKIGIIWVGYQCEDMVERSLAPWIAARKSRLGGHEFIICAVSVPFEGFEHGAPDKTRSLLGMAVSTSRDDIDHAVVRDRVMKEIEARGSALTWLVEQGVTHLIQVDADEFYTTDQIVAILRFVETRSVVDWFRLSLKNAIFTPDQFLAEPFTPPRIHKVYNAGGFVTKGFHQDNNVYYERPWNQERILDTQMASVTVPKSVAWIRHESWLSNDRSRRKISYQLDSRGWPECSFRWDPVNNELAFNEEFFSRKGLPLPEIVRE